MEVVGTSGPEAAVKRHNILTVHGFRTGNDGRAEIVRCSAERMSPLRDKLGALCTPPWRKWRARRAGSCKHPKINLYYNILNKKLLSRISHNSRDSNGEPRNLNTLISSG